MSGIRSVTSSGHCICTNKFSTIFTNRISISCFFQNTMTLKLKMETQKNPKRPTCLSCSKPLSLCLCTRIKSPNFDNKVHLTILQHSLERKHPLNSAKIAKLGLKNVDVYTVTDVKFDAQFNVQPLVLDDDGFNLLEEECTSSVCGNASESLDCNGSLAIEGSREGGFDQVSGVDLGDGFVGVSDSERFTDEIVDFDKNDDQLLEQCDVEITGVSDNLMSGDAMEGNPEALLSVTVGKYGGISNISHQWKLQDEGKTPNLEDLVASPEVLESLARGFVVQKLQKKQKSGSVELEQFEEFRITVPPGSALLFPAQNAVPAETIDFEVKNLILLDGTWSKANRMYNENPWLRILPSVRLDMEKLSMFSEVRRQPKPGYLSTIESIVYALKALGESEELEGLDNLLDVFESMVEDQRRCKDEALKKLSPL